MVSTPGRQPHQQATVCEARLGCQDGSPQLGAPGPGLEGSCRHQDIHGMQSGLSRVLAHRHEKEVDFGWSWPQDQPVLSLKSLLTVTSAAPGEVAVCISGLHVLSKRNVRAQEMPMNGAVNID